MDKQERQSCKALLSVHDESLSALVADDDGAKEVVAVPLDLVTGMARPVRIEELSRQVVNQFSDLPLLPCVLPLVEINRVLGLVEQLPDCASASVDGSGTSLGR